MQPVSIAVQEQQPVMMMAQQPLYSGQGPAFAPANGPNLVGNLAEVEEQAELAREDDLDRRSQLSAPVMRTAVPQA